MDIELSVYLKSLDYDDDEIEYMVEDVLPVAKKYIGWEDRRRDKRFIVKFPDIIYDKGFNGEDKTMDSLFEDFCSETYEWVKEEMSNRKCYLNNIATRYNIGNYSGLVLEREGIHDITNDNILEVVRKVFDQSSYDADETLRQHIETVNILQELEDTYKDWWGEYIRNYKEELYGE